MTDLGLAVSDQTRQALEGFVALLAKWNPTVNLVSPASLAEAWTRHIADSAQLLPLAGDRPTWADLGSGGGLPGMVIAILSREAVPDRRVTLVESDHRKAAFLREAARLYAPDTRILAERIEQAAPLNADVVSARALAPLDRLIPLVARHLAPDGMALLPKGRGVEAELASARRAWDFAVQSLPSRTDPQGAILQLTECRRAH